MRGSLGTGGVRGGEWARFAPAPQVFLWNPFLGLPLGGFGGERRWGGVETGLAGSGVNPLTLLRP